MNTTPLRGVRCRYPGPSRAILKDSIWPRIKTVCKINTKSIQGPLPTFTRKEESSYLRKLCPTALARCIVACSVESAARALPIIYIAPALRRARSAEEIRSNVHESPHLCLCPVPFAVGIRTSQPHLGRHGSPGLLFLELECLF